jgi:hypothetical protein
LPIILVLNVCSFITKSNQAEQYAGSTILDTDGEGKPDGRYGKVERTSVLAYGNPYSAVSLSDHFGRHSNLANPPFANAAASTGSLPNIYILSPSRVDLFGEIVDMVREVTHNKTGRPHDKKSYDSIFIEGIWGRKPGDVVVLLFTLDTDDRIPVEYEDLLPVAWPGIESALKQGKPLELRSVARETNIILLAAPTAEKLRQLVGQSSLLIAIGGRAKTSGEQSPDESWTRTGRTKGPAAYIVNITDDNWREAVVSCRIVTDGGLSLWMNNNGAPKVQNGHASFVRNFKAVDSAGNTLRIKDFGQARWMLSLTEIQPVTLSYEVLLEHDKSDLPWGRDEASYVTEDGAPVKSFKDIQTVAKRLTPGGTIDVILLRGGKEITNKITLGGEGQQVPLERKIEVRIDRKAQLDSRQKAILSGITGQQQDERVGNK